VRSVALDGGHERRPRRRGDADHPRAAVLAVAYPHVAVSQAGDFNALVAAAAERGCAPGGRAFIRLIGHEFSLPSRVIISRDAEGDRATSAAACSNAS
jgi:hypothetical protein